MGGVPALIAFHSDPGVTAWYDPAAGACTGSSLGRSEWVAGSPGRDAILAAAGTRRIDVAMQFGVKWRPLGHVGAGRTMVIRLH